MLGRAGTSPTWARICSRVLSRGPRSSLIKDRRYPTTASSRPDLRAEARRATDGSRRLVNGAAPGRAAGPASPPHIGRARRCGPYLYSLKRALLMRRRAALHLLCLVLIGVPARADWVMGRGIAITDGDTLTILTTDRLQHRVRLAGIDTPRDLAVVGCASFEPFATAHLVSTLAAVAEIPARTSEKPISTAFPE